MLESIKVWFCRLVDDIPVQLCYKVQVMDQSRSTHCERSFPIGCYVDEKGEQRDFCNSDVSSCRCYDLCY